MYKNILLIIVGLVLASTPFWAMGIWNEENDNMPCYDNHDNLIQDAKCTGVENQVMNTFWPFILIIVVFGAGLAGASLGHIVWD